MIGITRFGRNWLTDSEQGHPNRRGQRAIADVVRVALQQESATETSPANP